MEQGDETDWIWWKKGVTISQKKMYPIFSDWIIDPDGHYILITALFWEMSILLGCFYASDSKQKSALCSNLQDIGR